MMHVIFLVQVLALPLPHRPLFPGVYMPIYVKDPKVLAALVESRKRQAPYAGAFLLKDDQGTDPNVVSASDTEKNICELKGKDLFTRLHEVGTLAQITSIQGDQVILIGHRRIRMTEVEQPYNKDDDVIKATSFEVLSTLRDVLKTSSLWKDHVQTYIQLVSLKKWNGRAKGQGLNAIFLLREAFAFPPGYWCTSDRSIRGYSSFLISAVLT
ncbi:Lon protease -like protein, mitochondrial [Capsicum baccatum]|uniref:Lon protease-like protein, mitochondrial n=1 Tax=Capsicum baccatum TaxID=33114 RepID=A0A2G2VSS5_CAPBA|nr:Lon protease -like protein, mitochondrial [Capsicum baccatum]